jgi:hypothetical protein
MARNALTLIALAVMTSPALAASSHLAGRTGGGHHGGGGGFLGFIAFVACALVVGVVVAGIRADIMYRRSEKIHSNGWRTGFPNEGDQREWREAPETSAPGGIARYGKP